MTINAADRKSIRAAEKLAKQEQVEREQVVRELCSSASGRKYLWDRLSAAHIFNASFNGDIHYLVYAEGERNQGLMLLADIMQACPDQFIAMMREANERSVRAGQQPRSQNGDGGTEGRSVDPTDPGEPANYDSEGSWIGEGPDPRGEEA